MEKFISTPIASGLFSKAGYVASADQIVFKDDNGNITQTLPEAIDQLDTKVVKNVSSSQSETTIKAKNNSSNVAHLTVTANAVNSMAKNITATAWNTDNPGSNEISTIIMNGSGITLTGKSINIQTDEDEDATVNDTPIMLRGDVYATQNNIGTSVTIYNSQTTRYDTVPVVLSSEPSSNDLKNGVAPSWTAVNALLSNLPVVNSAQNGVFNKNEYSRLAEIIDFLNQEVSVEADTVYADRIRSRHLTSTSNTISVDSVINANQDLSVSGVLYALNIESPDYNIANVTTGSSNEGDYINIGDASASGIKLYSTEDVKVIDDEDSVSHVITENNYHNYLNFDTIRGLSSTVDDTTLDSSLKNAIASFIERSLSDDRSFNITEGIVKSNGGYVIKMARFAPVDSNNNVHVIVEGNISIAGGIFSISNSFEIYDVTYAKSNNTWTFSNYSRASLSWV